jgi:hypothetical protein
VFDEAGDEYRLLSTYWLGRTEEKKAREIGSQSRGADWMALPPEDKGGTLISQL